MGLKIVELFGYSPSDNSKVAQDSRTNFRCPFIKSTCTKTLNDGLISGACAVRQIKNPVPIICCPNRLYAGDYKILKDIAEEAFGQNIHLISGRESTKAKHDGSYVVVFGKRWGKELKLPKVDGRGGFFVDWVLALIGGNGQLSEFVAVEVQSIDTTGNYRDERATYLDGRNFTGSSKAGMNWENVSKRILPQIIYKGNVLRRERLCIKGLFFVCPSPVHERIQDRLGRDMMAYPTFQPGSMTFRWYDIGPEMSNGEKRTLNCAGQFITTVDQVAMAFTAPRNLPPPNVYEQAINKELGV